MVALRDAEEVGDDEHREGTGEFADVVAFTLGQDVVEEFVGQAVDELFVLLEALGGDQAHQQAAMVRMLRRVHRGELIVHRQRRAVLLDEIGDVVALGREREAREGSGHRDA